MIGFHFLFLCSSIYLSSTFSMKNIELTRLIHWSPEFLNIKFHLQYWLAAALTEDRRENNYHENLVLRFRGTAGESERGRKWNLPRRSWVEKPKYQLKTSPHLNSSQFFLLPPFHHSVTLYIPQWETLISPDKLNSFPSPSRNCKQSFIFK